jgi:LacI family transcriptional regulator
VKTGKVKTKIRVQDIAKVLNISASTVSRALNDHPRISKDTKDKVKLAASRLGYQSGLPQLMNPEKAEAVVVLLPSLEHSIYREVLSGVTDYLHENAFQTFVVDTRCDDEQAHSFFQSYKKYGISGIIHLISNKKIPGDFYALPLKEGLPLVTVCEPEAATGVSSVMPDLFEGLYKIGQYLKSLEITKLALLLEDENKPEDCQIVSSLTSVLEALKMDDAGLSLFYLGKEGMWPVKEIEALLTGTERPQALLVKGTYSASEVLHITKRLGLNIPDDLLLIAMDADSGAPGTTTNLSLLKFPAYEMGYAAAEMIIDQIQHPDTERKTEIKPVQFILKGSAIRMK